MQLLCAECHLDNDTGTLAGSRCPTCPTQFGAAHSANITRDPETGIGSWTDGELAYLPSHRREARRPVHALRGWSSSRTWPTRI